MTALKSKLVKKRGFSLIEAMVAGAVLIVGLTGATAMLLQGASNSRSGQQMMLSSNYATQVLQQLQATGYGSLAATTGTFAAGTAPAAPGTVGGYFTDASGRKYHAAYMITDQATAFPTDCGTAGTGCFKIDVEIKYTDALGKTVTKMASGFMSKVPVNGP
jgi:Tfp pilus assembly protein PilV